MLGRLVEESFHGRRQRLNLRDLSLRHRRRIDVRVDAKSLRDLGKLGGPCNRSTAVLFEGLTSEMGRRSVMRSGMRFPRCHIKAPAASSSSASTPALPQQARRRIDPSFLHCPAPPTTPLSPLGRMLEKAMNLIQHGYGFSLLSLFSLPFFLSLLFSLSPFLSPSLSL